MFSGSLYGEVKSMGMEKIASNEWWASIQELEPDWMAFNIEIRAEYGSKCYSIMARDQDVSLILD